MKYCSKCGKELFDEAVICTGCGCPVDGNNKTSQNNKKKNFNTAFVLNIIAIVVSFGSGFIYSSLVDTDTVSKGLRNFFSDPIVYRLFALVALSFVLCVVNYVSFCKGKSNNVFVWLYVLSVVATVGYFAVFSPVYFFTTICGSGILFPVAPILQVIAAVKLVQTSK